MRNSLSEMVQQPIKTIKSLYFFVMAMVLAYNVSAQKSEGGLPLTMDPFLSRELYEQLYIPTVTLQAPDINALLWQDSIDIAEGKGLLRIGALVPADIDVNNSGSIISLNDGRKIWRLKVKISAMEALGLYYDKFRLPEGVKYYLFNSNGKQILGAYTNNENPDDGIWANEKVQGEIVNLEMDIAPNVDISTINFHINNVAVFYRATAYLQKFTTPGINLRTTSTIFKHYDSSSSCEVEAMCSPGSSFPNQRNASVHIEYISHGYAYAGSGTLVNNTKQDCTPYLLTATHILNSQNNGNATFAQWIIYFNYQKPTCSYTGPEPSTSETVVGAYFRARAPYDSSSNKLIGDFMLLLLKQNPTTYGFYLAGWDNTNHPLSINPGTYTSFHHPWGDVKKVSQATNIDGTANFNGGALSSHYGVEWSIGGDEEGSSGGGLFNANGRLIGILSGGKVQSQPCAATNSGGQKMSDYALYSKLSYDWLYTAYSPSSASTRLKDWLDPTGSGVSTLDGLTACTTTISETQKSNTDWNIYPNPSKGIIYIEHNSINGTNTKVEVYNMLGEVLTSINLQADNTNRYKIDISSYPAGIYLVRIIQDNTILSRKITLAK